VSAAWLTVAALCVGTAAMKATGPLALRGRQPSARALGVIALVAPVVIAALVLQQTLGGREAGLYLDARLVGLAAAGAALAARLPVVLVVLLAAGATAAVRAAGG
jgi:hypothetical protein